MEERHPADGGGRSEGEPPHCGHYLFCCSIVGADWVEERHPADGGGRSEGEQPHCGHCICFVVPS